MIRRSNPFDFSDTDSIFGRMSRQFDEMNRQLGSWDGGVGELAHHRGVAIDISEHDDNLVVVADLPGFEREDIDLTLSGRALTIHAEREMTTENGSGNQTEGGNRPESGEYLRRERRSQSVRRSLRLPAEIDEETATAAYKNGVLTVTLPKQQVEEDEDSHRIDIN